MTKSTLSPASPIPPGTSLLKAGASRRKAHELVPFLAVWAAQYQRDYKLDGLHPVHYDLMVKYGARMVDFKRATNAKEIP